MTGLTTALSVAQGGTGSTSLTANNVLLGNGTSALQKVAPGTSGNVLTSNGTTWASATPVTGIGDGQTWQDVTASRSTNTTYTNNTGKPIMVMLRIITGGAGATVGGVTIMDFSSANLNTATNGNFIVPTGATYSVTGSINKWFELR